MSEKIWKVAVLGAAGRMGSEAVRAVNTAEDMDLVAALGRGDDLQELVDSGAEIVIDLTVPDSSEANVRFAVEHGMHAVVGTTGWTPERLDSLRELLGEHPGVGVLIAPNFAIKVDAPSGTAVHTARKVAAARAEAGVGPSPDATTSDPLGSRGAVVDGVHVHAVRLRGMVAHQEILLGDPGQQLVIRHDSFDRASFMPGVLLGVREVAAHPGLSVGLDAYMDLS